MLTPDGRLLAALLLCIGIVIGLGINEFTTLVQEDIKTQKVYTNQGIYILDYQTKTISSQYYGPIKSFNSIDDMNDWFTLFTCRIACITFMIPKEAYAQGDFWSDDQFPIVQNCYYPLYDGNTHVVNYATQVDTLGWMLPTGDIDKILVFIKTH